MKNIPPEQIHLLRYSEVARRLNVSERTVRRMIELGRLKRVLISRYNRVRESELLRFIEGRES